MVERLQVKASSIGRILNNLEKKYNGTYEKGEAGSDMKKSSSGQPLTKRSPKIQMIPPFNASKIRKSPSTESTAAAAQVQEELNELAEEMGE